MTEFQESKLDRVLELTAQHGVELRHLSSRLASVAVLAEELDEKVLRSETVREDRWRRVAIKIAAVSAIFSGLSALAAISRFL